LLKAKKEKLVDKNLIGFIAATQNKAFQNLASAAPVNKLIEKTNLNTDVAKPAPAAEKVPEAAKFVLDDETIAK
jgi:hypothetical protein